MVDVGRVWGHVIRCCRKVAEMCADGCDSNAHTPMHQCAVELIELNELNELN